MVETKTRSGNFFEDFKLGQVIQHATPRTLGPGDQALYQALYGSRFPLHSSAVFAQEVGFPSAPLDDLLVFHVVFGKTVPDISLNAVANLGYAAGRFARPVFAGDTLTATSEVIGLKENSNGKTGVVYLRSRGHNQLGELVLDYVRWVMVRKRDPQTVAPAPSVPDLPARVEHNRIHIPVELKGELYDAQLAGSSHLWDDYAPGERIDHLDGMTIEEGEHQLATRLYQNTARVHFNQHVEGKGRFGRRLVYGGHVISLARALSFNGLANAMKLLAINAGTHANPCFAGDTIYAWSEVLEKEPLQDNEDFGLLRVRTVACKNETAQAFPLKDETGAYLPAVVLDFDYSVLMPRRRRRR